MANQEHLNVLNQGVETWNQWRRENDDIEPNLRDVVKNGANLTRVDLSGANLSGANLSGANLSNAYLGKANLVKANLSGADLSEANLRRVNFSGANLSEANLRRTHLWIANLSGADLSGANLGEADLSGADLSGADLSGADLSGANLGEADLGGTNLSSANLWQTNLENTDLRGTTLRGANLSGHNFNNVDFSGMDLSDTNLNETSLIKTNFSHANLSDCSIYGIAAWDIQLDEQTVQKNLTITPPDQPAITVDNLKTAQFIYLLLNNAEIRDVIDTIARKAVLILGRFTPERKIVVDALREALRSRGYLPILFDFDKPSTRNFTETVRTLAHLSRFIIADLTDPSSIPQELYAIVPTLAVPVLPVLLEGKREYAMSLDLLTTYHWMLPSTFTRIK